MILLVQKSILMLGSKNWFVESNNQFLNTKIDFGDPRNQFWIPKIDFRHQQTILGVPKIIGGVQKSIWDPQNWFVAIILTIRMIILIVHSMPVFKIYVLLKGSPLKGMCGDPSVSVS